VRIGSTVCASTPPMSSRRCKPNSAIPVMVVGRSVTRIQERGAPAGRPCMGGTAARPGRFHVRHPPGSSHAHDRRAHGSDGAFGSLLLADQARQAGAASEALGGA
jgi:hypothetical protein